MTGVGKSSASDDDKTLLYTKTARPECVLEGLSDDGVTWNEITFNHKPTDVAKRPTLIAPFQPRLDWQMWFAALGHYSHNVWLVHLVYKLMGTKPISTVRHGITFVAPEILELLDADSYPFKSSPLQSVRIRHYNDYDFTRWPTQWAANSTVGLELVPYRQPEARTNKDNKSARANHWWSRGTASTEYLPALDRSNPSLKEYLKGNGIKLKSYKSPAELHAVCIKGINGDFAAVKALQTLACKTILLREQRPNMALEIFISIFVASILTKAMFGRLRWR